MQANGLKHPVFKLTDPQRSMLMKSEEGIQKGNVISDKKLNAEEDQWLKYNLGRSRQIGSEGND